MTLRGLRPFEGAAGILDKGLMLPQPTRTFALTKRAQAARPRPETTMTQPAGHGVPSAKAPTSPAPRMPLP